MKYRNLLTLALFVVVAIVAFKFGQHNGREAEYIRVVSTIADAYGYDPSEVESDANLVDADGNIKR